jgi:DNA-binding MarR family transcriptional regulator
MATGRKTGLKVLRAHDVPAEHLNRATVLELLRVSGRWVDLATGILRGHGLTFPHFEVLMSLHAGEGISQQDLSERLLLTKGNICVIVQKLEASGLIDRRTDPVDQRVHRLYLTDDGRRLIARVAPDHQKLGDRIFATFSPADRKSLFQLLCRLGQAIDDERE